MFRTILEMKISCIFVFGGKNVYYCKFRLREFWKADQVLVNVQLIINGVGADYPGLYSLLICFVFSQTAWLFSSNFSFLVQKVHNNKNVVISFVATRWCNCKVLFLCHSKGISSPQLINQQLCSMISLFVPESYVRIFQNQQLCVCTSISFYFSSCSLRVHDSLPALYHNLLNCFYLCSPQRFHIVFLKQLRVEYF